MSRIGVVCFGLLVIIVGTACGMSSLGGAPGEGAAGTGTGSDSAEPAEAPTVPVPINQACQPRQLPHDVQQ
jgi:hypothetical protein